jgi:nitrogen regulatory protein PII
MKKIEAIIRASRFEAVKAALDAKDIHFFTFYEVKGYGHQKGEQINYRGAVYDQGYIARIKMEIILSEPFVESAILAIMDSAYTGDPGDGIIFVCPLDDIINIRSGEHGSEAINK